jgi:hypothetical protein
MHIIIVLFTLSELQQQMFGIIIIIIVVAFSLS